MCTMNPDLTSGQRLMAESQHMGVEVKVAADKLDRLEAENAKLRELVQDYDKVLSSMHALCDCDFVPLNDAVLLGLRSRMYELGIEVE